MRSPAQCDEQGGSTVSISQLATLDNAGTPPRSVIADPISAHAIKRQLINADIPRNRQRATLKAMYDGHPPYDPKKLTNMGQGDRSNVNYKRCAAMVQQQSDSYLDAQFEVPLLAQVNINWGISGKGYDFGMRASEHFDYILRQWTGYYDVCAKSNFNRCFYGWGPRYFEDRDNWRTFAADAGQVYVDKDADTDMSRLDLMMIKKLWRFHELYRKIEDPQVAENLGWNVEAVRKAIVRAANTNQTEQNLLTWEKLNDQIKGNDLYWTSISPASRCYDLLAVEFDGNISRRIMTDWDTEEILYENPDVADSLHQVLLPFFLSKQESLWHNVRGSGALFYNVLRQLDLIGNQIVDMTLIGGSLVLQPTTAAAYDKLNTVRMGPVTILPPNVNYINTVFPNLSQGAIVTHNMLMQTLQQTSGEYQARGDSTEPGERPSATQVNIDVNMMARLSSQQYNQWYNEIDNEYEQMFCRMANPNLPDEKSVRGRQEWCVQAREFQKRCRDDGIPLAALQKPYLQNVKACRALGQGSSALRQQQAGQLTQMLPLAPSQQARAVMLKDIFTSTFGNQVASRYFPALPSIQLRSDAKTASLENNDFLDGHSVPVMDYENAVLHLSIHMPPLMQVAQQIEQASGQAGKPNLQASQAVYTQLAAALPHCSQHLQSIASDPTQQQEVQQVVNELRQLQGVATKLQQQLGTAATAAQQAALKQSQAQTAEAQQMQLKAAKLQLDVRKQTHKEQVDKARLLIEAERTKHEMGINNLNTALQIQQTLNPPAPSNDQNAVPV